MNGAIDANRGVKAPKNYKLMVDPMIVKGGIKVYRYEGIIPNDPTAPAVIPRDPRNHLVAKVRTRLEPLEIPVPRFASAKFFCCCFCLPNARPLNETRVRFFCLDSKSIRTMSVNRLPLK